MLHEPIDQAASDTAYYSGLDWSSPNADTRRARSQVTGATYLVGKDASGLWSVQHGYPEALGRPKITITNQVDEQIALIAAERHDYRYWKSTQIRDGLKPVFVGSAGVVADLFAALPEYDREDTCEMLVGEYILEDGRPFSAAASFFETIKSSMKQERNGSLSITLNIPAEDIPLWLMQAPANTRLLVGAVHVSSTDDDSWLERGKTAIRRAAVLPADNTFQSWMMQRYDRHGLIKTAMAKTSSDVEKAVAETLRRYIGCPTRSHLATNRDAIMRIEKLDREFYQDMQRGYHS